MVQPIYKTYETVIDPATGAEKTVLIHTETADAVKLGDFYPKQIATAIPWARMPRTASRLSLVRVLPTPASL